MKTARVTKSWMVPSKYFTTRGATEAVSRLNSRNGSRPLLDGCEGAVLDPVSGVQRQHFVDVFGGLFVDDIDDVVDRDHSRELALRVDDRDGHQVVVRHLPRHLLLVGFRVHADHFPGHDVLQRRIGPGKQQLP